jgi:hyperosmotically inducible periplasmic protein
MKFILGTFVLLCALLVAPPGSPDIDRPDGWITMKAKIALIGKLGRHALDVNVDTIDGKVTLHGKLATDAQRAEAEGAVKGIEGVKGLRDLVQVVPAPVEKAVEATDDALREAVEAALKADPLLKDSGISVASVNKAVVLLKGETPRLSDELRAMQIAARQPGVHIVGSEITHDDGKGIFDDELARPKAMAKEAGEDARDAWITTDVKLRLMAAKDVPGLDINVDTTDGVVTLFGTVESDAVRNAALASARSAGGVREVRDSLSVSDKLVTRATLTDAEIKAQLKDLLAGRRASIGNDVSIEVEQGVAKLSGSVNSVSARVSASSLARQAGAVAVVNELEVKPQG